MPILNYTTKIPAEQTAAEIMSILVKKGATDILTQAWRSKCPDPPANGTITSATTTAPSWIVMD